ncbi:MAG: 5'/3'-nucleotidase SurE [Treponema sp.]|jgi:5'-nucleotidase|nr:5'/3'-nucleotidase SurE [Treponema sp.]
MNLLLTNDDGIDGDGLHVLADRLSRTNQVWIIAPSQNRSAVSNGITMGAPLKLKKITDRTYTCSGLPVDCVVTALKSDILPFRPDAVISGINRGANIGTDILYSGTAAAARQAVLYTVPGIALSVESRNNVWQYDALADFAANNMENLVKLCEVTPRGKASADTKGIFVNVNALSAASYKGVRMTTLATREYRDTVHLCNAPDGNIYSFFFGGDIVSWGAGTSDSAAVDDGYISVSRVYAQSVPAPDVVDGMTFTL